MATSNGVPPSFGGSPNDANGSTGTGAPAAVPAPAAPAAQGPNSAGLNPGPITNAAVPAPGGGYGVAQFAQIANQKVLDGANAGASPAQPAKPYSENQLVQSLADTLGVKAEKGQPLEDAVVRELADRFGVKIARSAETTEGTGTGQGAIGQERHNIASWFDTVAGAFTINAGIRKVTNIQSEDAQRKQIAAMKSPRLRELALAKLNRQNQEAEQHGGGPETAEPVPTESKKALNEIIAQVQEKLGVQGAGPNALENIARSVNAPYQTGPISAATGTPQTYAQNFQSFVAQWNKNERLSNGQSFDDQWVDNLENMGLLNADSNTANLGKTQSSVSKGLQITGAAAQAAPSAGQVFNAYQNFLLQSQQAGQSPLQYMQAAPNSAVAQDLKNGPASEMYAFTQGIAQEMGVGLMPYQINEIANFYGASAAVADDPSSVEDQIKDAVVKLYSPPTDPSNPNSPNQYGVVNPSGVANTMFTDIQQQALAYQIPVSAGQITAMVQSDLQGATVESLFVAADAAEAKAQEQFESQAKGLYPTLAPQISQGQTVQTLTAPYLNVAEAITGVPASTMTVDMQSGGVSKWGAFLQGGQNPSGSTQQGEEETPGKQMMTLDEWKTYLMQDPQYGFQNTKAAKNMGQQITSAILNEFGKVNTMGGTSEPFNAYQGVSDLSANTS